MANTESITMGLKSTIKQYKDGKSTLNRFIRRLGFLALGVTAQPGPAIALQHRITEAVDRYTAPEPETTIEDLVEELDGLVEYEELYKETWQYEVGNTFEANLNRSLVIDKPSLDFMN